MHIIRVCSSRPGTPSCISYNRYFCPILRRDTIFPRAALLKEWITAPLLKFILICPCLKSQRPLPRTAVERAPFYRTWQQWIHWNLSFPICSYRWCSATLPPPLHRKTQNRMSKTSSALGYRWSRFCLRLFKRRWLPIFAVTLGWSSYKSGMIRLSRLGYFWRRSLRGPLRLSSALSRWSLA